MIYWFYFFGCCCDGVSFCLPLAKVVRGSVDFCAKTKPPRQGHSRSMWIYIHMWCSLAIPPDSIRRSPRQRQRRRRRCCDRMTPAVAAHPQNPKAAYYMNVACGFSPKPRALLTRNTQSVSECVFFVLFDRESAKRGRRWWCVFDVACRNLGSRQQKYVTLLSHISITRPIFFWAQTQRTIVRIWRPLCPCIATTWYNTVTTIALLS